MRRSCGPSAARSGAAPVSSPRSRYSRRPGSQFLTRASRHRLTRHRCGRVAVGLVSVQRWLKPRYEAHFLDHGPQVVAGNGLSSRDCRCWPARTRTVVAWSMTLWSVPAGADAGRAGLWLGTHPVVQSMRLGIGLNVAGCHYGRRRRWRRIRRPIVHGTTRRAPEVALMTARGVTASLSCTSVGLPDVASSCEVSE